MQLKNIYFLLILDKISRFSGNFDRYSATRRTRRYKKTQDPTGDKDKDKSSDVSSLELIYDEKSVQRPNTLVLADEEVRADAMLRVWQDKLKRRDTASSSLSRDIDAALAEITRSGEDLQHLSRSVSTTTTSSPTMRSSRLPVSQPPPVVAVTNTVLSPVMQESRPREPVAMLAERAVTSRERHRSMIDPSQVKEAVRVTNNPPSQVNQEIVNDLPRNGSSPRDRKGQQDDESVKEEKDLKPIARELEKNIRSADNQSTTRQSSLFRSRFIPDINVTSSPPSSSKSRDQELNDEGFEETQSLVSETLSQETSSGNYETDTHDSTRCSPAELGSYGGEQRRRTTTMVDDDDLDDRGRSSVDKLASDKAFDKKTRNASEKSSFLPKHGVKSSALRKTESSKRTSNVIPLGDSGMLRGEVQRSGSRSSLRSSRSSLNSTTSVNTVRNLAANHAHLRNYTSAIRTLTNDLRKSSPSSSPLPPKDAIDKRRPSPRQIGVSRIPASRSSSSGSSVGPVLRNVRKTSEVDIMILSVYGKANAIPPSPCCSIRDLFISIYSSNFYRYR